MKTIRAVTGFAVACALLGCSTPPAAPPTPPRAEDPAVSALAAVDRRDWAAAIPLLRKALEREPESVRLHYSLATAATYVGVRDEAVREFGWVLAHARAGSDEAIAARTWLVDAGALAGREADSRGDGAATATEANATSGISGRVLWADAGQPPSPRARMQVHLIGLRDTAAHGRRYTVRTDQDGRFQLTNVLPGSYKLTDRIAGRPTWRLRVDLAAGRESQLDLTPVNSVSVRDDFRDERGG